MDRNIENQESHPREQIADSAEGEMPKVELDAMAKAPRIHGSVQSLEEDDNVVLGGDHDLQQSPQQQTTAESPADPHEAMPLTESQSVQNLNVQQSNSRIANTSADPQSQDESDHMGTPKPKQAGQNPKGNSKAKVSEKLIVYEVKDKENDEGLSAHFEQHQPDVSSKNAMTQHLQPKIESKQQNGGKTERLKESSNLFEENMMSSTSQHHRRGDPISAGGNYHRKQVSVDMVSYGTSAKKSQKIMKSKIVTMSDDYLDQFEYKQEAIPLIIYDQDTQKFSINEEAVGIAQQIKGPIGVVTVVGMYRTGKSYLLNRVIINAKKGEGFGVGPSINPCTKGLWMWATPLIGFTEDGERINVIVVDTEGIGGLDEDVNHDNKIFAIALLLSSFFIYNSIGSIDENALQNLSFVTNLSKLITVKSSQSQQNDDQDSTDEIQNFMPKFMWIVRDFSLQLVDDQNNEISQKQYLERALREYHMIGSSSARQNQDQVQKNLIKKHFKEYFTNRDCCTLVRPIVDESKIQNLDSLKVEDLRSEFVEQAFVIRNKILQNMTAKKFKNQIIDGKMWIGMIQQYVDAMNGGQVPSIENTWTYLVRQKAMELYERLKSKFDEGLQTDLQMPANDRDLEQCLEFHAEKFVTEFKSQMNNDCEIVEDYQPEIQNFLAQRQNELKAENYNQCRELSQNSLTQLYQELNQRFMSDVSPQALNLNIQSLAIALQEIQQIYEMNVPEFSDKFLVFLNLKCQFFNDLIYFVHGHLENENESVNKILNELKDRNQSSILETKETYRLERQTIETQLKEAMLAKAEAEASLELLREQYNSLKEQKDHEDKHNQCSLKDIKKQFHNKIDEQNKLQEEYENKMQDMHRKNIQVESEFEKQKALLEQKVSFLEKTLEEKMSKEREYMTNWSSQKSELSNEIRQVCQKYELEVKQISIQLQEEKEKSQELENQLMDAQGALQTKESEWKEAECRYKTMLDQSQQHAKSLEIAADALKNESLAGLESRLKEQTQELEELKKKMVAQEEKALQTEEELKQKCQQALKEAAIKEQKIEFQEIQLRDTKDQLDELNKQHQQIEEAMKKAYEEDQNQQSLKAKSEEIVSPTKVERLQRKVEELKEQLQAAHDKGQEQEIQFKLQETEFERLRKEFSGKIDEHEQEKSDLLSRLKSNESCQIGQVCDLENRHKAEIQKLEQELEDKQLSQEKEIKEIQKKSEESLAQLKSFYELEKQKLESRLREEREKAQKKIDQYQEEFDSKIRSEFTEKDQEMDDLRSELVELEQRYNQQETQIKHELSLKQQIIDTLERQNQDNKQRLELMESTRNQAFEKQLEFFEQQRYEYNQKIDKLQVDNLEKDRQIAQFQHKVERSTEDYERQIRDLTENSDTLQKERDSLSEKLDATKRKLIELQDEAQQNQLVFGRDQALSEQSIEFLQRKIEDIQNQYEEKIKMYEEKIKTIRQEMQEENQSNLERIQNEKDIWEQKFDQKRKALKEIEQQFNRENSELEKKLCVLQEKFTRLEQEKRKMEQEYKENIQQYESQIQNLDTSAGEALYYGNVKAEQMMELKSQQQELERQVSDLQSMYDKDKALWEGKCQFLENQKENYKKDLIESQRKFEITLEQLQKRGTSAQDKFEQNHNVFVKALETKFKNQIKEMHESHQCLQHEITNKSKRMEEENKQLKEQNALLKQDSEIEKQHLENKYQDIQRENIQLKNEINEARSSTDQKLQNLQAQTQKDRDSFKARLQEAEKKAKDADTKRNQLIFDIEKERARWQVEHDNIISQNREKDDIIANLERRRDILFKENERLKSDWKVNNGRQSLERLSIGSATQNGAAKIGFSMNKVNLSNNQANVGMKRTPNLGGNGLRSSNNSNLPPQPQRLNFSSNGSTQKIVVGNQRYAGNITGSQGSQVANGDDNTPPQVDQKFEPQDDTQSFDPSMGGQVQPTNDQSQPQRTNNHLRLGQNTSTGGLHQFGQPSHNQVASNQNLRLQMHNFAQKHSMINNKQGGGHSHQHMLGLGQHNKTGNHTSLGFTNAFGGSTGSSQQKTVQYNQKTATRYNNKSQME